MYKILIADPLNEAGLEIFRQAGTDLRLLGEDEKDQLPGILPEYDAMVVRSGTTVTAELLAHGKNLKVVGRAGIGVDNVDVARATELGILVVNAPTANLVSATEHTFALLLALARNVPAADRSLKTEQWNRKGFLGLELHGRVLGVVGLGRIGQAVAARGRAFGMKVVAYDPYLDPAVAARQEIELTTLDEVVERADVLTLHVPLTESTRDLLSADRIATMKSGAVLVNCARGGVVDDEALLAALDDGRLAGAALDVFAEEPPTDFRLAQHPKVVATPHIGAQTKEAQERVATQTAEMVLAALDGSLTVTAVNLPFPTTGARGEPYLQLGEQLGRLASSVLGGSLRKVEVDLWGVDEDLRLPVTVAAVKGALSPFLDQAVNYVNAERIASERGLEVVRSTHQQTGDYAHLVGVRLHGEAGSIEIAGTVFGERDQRVVEFDEYRLEFRAAGRLLVLRNRDVPGVVGKIGTLLGEEGANIAEIHLARGGGRGEALAVLRLDQDLKPAALNRLRDLPEVRDALTVNLD